MDIEILSELLKYSDDKKKDIVEYVDVYDKNIFNNYLLYDEKKDNIYLNDKIIAVKKNTLEIECIGKTIKNKNNTICIQKRGNNVCINIHFKDYYIFISESKNKNNDRYFYEELLKII